jgi:pimeloyl-ACP methyl ester carboxylesterase
MKSFTPPQHFYFAITYVALLMSSHNYLTAAEQFADPEDISFTAKCDGTTQKYVVLLPVDFSSDRPHTLMIALHGNEYDRWEFVNDTFEVCRSARDVALKHDMIFVSPDYRAKTSWMGPKAEADMVQIIEELKEKYQIENTILIGSSMGGSAALTFTALHPELIDCMVAMNGTANHLTYEKFQDVIQASFGGTKQEISAEYKLRSAEYWPEKFTMPVAMSTGGKDFWVPPESAIRLVKVLKKLNPSVLHIHRPDGGHGTTYDDAVEMFEFVIEHIHQKNN